MSIFRCVTALALIAKAQALIVDDINTLNGTAPANGAPWTNVGAGNGASGVYLKKGWVVGARHVFGGDTSAVITFTSQTNVSSTYSGGTIFVLKNTDGSASDVVLFNIGTVPAGIFSEIGVAASTPTVSTSLTYIGYG